MKGGDDMKKVKLYKPVSIVTAVGVRACSSKQSKAGAGCKASKNVPCRIS